MENILTLIEKRKSVRSYDGTPLKAEDRRALEDFLAQVETPFRIPMEFRILDGAAQALSSPVVTGTELYAAGKLPRGPMAEAAFGYAFEAFILYAVSLGVGTVWIAGTMDRPAFERAMELADGEMMPAVTPLGYPAKKRSLRDAAMRRAIRADSRLPFESLFFNGSFDAPMSPEGAGVYREALEAVRLAPSAVNKQPWRIVRQSGDVFHFYKKPSLPSDARGDVQKLDLGIALAHFVLALEVQGVAGEVFEAEPALYGKENEEYLFSWRRT